VNAKLGNPGDNFMVFDNYTVTAEPYPISLAPVGRLSNGTFLLRLTAEPGRQYDIEVSEDLKDWFLLKPQTVGPDGTVIVGRSNCGRLPPQFLSRATDALTFKAVSLR